MTTQEPGEKPSRPGEYREVGPRGGQVRNPRQVTIEPGDTRLPPTQKAGRRGSAQALPNHRKQGAALTDPTWLLATMTLWDYVNIAGSIATVAALLILVYVTAKPAVNRWATVKFLRAIYNASLDDLQTGPLHALPLRRRVAVLKRRLWYRLYQHLMTKAHRINHLRLTEACQATVKCPIRCWPSTPPTFLTT